MENLRREIDVIDSAMTDLFIKRLETVEKISEYKEKNNLPVFDEKREAEKIKKAAENVREEYKSETEEFIRFLMDISKRRQRRLRGENSI